MASLMLTEALSAPDAVARLLAVENTIWADLGARLRASRPPVAVTIARGSSDHAAAYLAYLIMTRLCVPVASLPMSVITLHRTQLATRGMLAVAISQSGQSPDVVESLRALRGAGAITAAMVNDTGSPLARVAEWCLGLLAGSEHAVAATKTCIASYAAAARLVGTWQNDKALLAALTGLPGQLAGAAGADWDAALPALAPATRAIIVSRGLGLSVAQEIALKLKETCGLHAEAFSSAEVRHGPMTLIGPAEPVLLLGMRGPALADLIGLAAELRARGGVVLLAAPGDCPGRDLTVPETGHPDLDPIATLQAVYPLLVRLAEARGMDPDAPPHLQKVTKTT